MMTTKYKPTKEAADRLAMRLEEKGCDTLVVPQYATEQGQLHPSLMGYEVIYCSHRTKKVSE